jgi:hypothetical protein
MLLNPRYNAGELCKDWLILERVVSQSYYYYYYYFTGSVLNTAKSQLLVLIAIIIYCSIYFACEFLNTAEKHNVNLMLS